MEEVVASLQEVDTEIQQLVQESAQILPGKARLQLQRETYTDGILAEVTDRLQNNWLKSDSTDKEMMPFYRRRDHLSVVDRTLVLDDKIVIPHSLRLEVLRKLHIAHPGMRRMVQLSRRYFYWPNMHEDIEKFVKSCDHCAQSSWLQSQSKNYFIHGLKHTNRGLAFILTSRGRFTDNGSLLLSTVTQGSWKRDCSLRSHLQQHAVFFADFLAGMVHLKY